MTGPRSFREAFTEDPADVKDRARLVGERDSARRIAVEMENELAEWEAEADLIIGLKQFALFVADLGKPSSLAYRRTLTLDDLVRRAAAALTGGGDDARP